MSRPTSSRQARFNSVKIVEVHENVGQEIIHITEDKLRLILRDYLDSIAQAQGWIAPLGILLPIVMTFCTAKFDTFLGFGPDLWRAIFLLVAIASGIWLVFVLLKRKNALTPDDFINRVKNKS